MKTRIAFENILFNFLILKDLKIRSTTEASRLSLWFQITLRTERKTITKHIPGEQKINGKFKNSEK